MFCLPLSAQTPVNTAFQQTAMELYQQGAEAERSGNFTLAENVYLDLLKRAKDNSTANNNTTSFQATANHRLAVLKAKEQKYTESEKYFGEARPFCENNVSFLCDYAKIYFDQKRFSAAEPLLKSAALAAPNDRKVLYNLGCTVASQEGRQTEGLRYLKLSLGEKEAYRELAKIYRQQGKDNEAGFALQRAEQITANQPIPQITEDIQEQLKKELSFYESKRVVAKLNSEAQQKEELAKKLEGQNTEQKVKVKVFPSVDNAAVKKLPSLTQSEPPSSASIRFLPADVSAEKDNNTSVKGSRIADSKITAKPRPDDKPAPPLRHIEVTPPAIVQLVPPQNPDDLPRAQLKAVNTPITAQKSVQETVSNNRINNTVDNTVPNNIKQESTPQVRYEFARIEPQKKDTAEKSNAEPVLAFRPKNDDSANAGLSFPPQETAKNEVIPAPVFSQGTLVLENPFRISPVQKVPVDNALVQGNSVQEFPVNREIVKTEIKPEAITVAQPVKEPVVEPVLKIQPKFTANWQEPEIPQYSPAAPPVAEKTNTGIIDIAAVPVERRPPVFESPVIDTSQRQETPQIAWASPAILLEETTLEPAKELAKEAAKELAKEPMPEITENIEIKETANITPMPRPELPMPILPKPTLPEPVEHPAVSEITASETPANEKPANEIIAAVPIPVMKPAEPKPEVLQEISKQEVSKPEVPQEVSKPEEKLHTAIAARPPLPEPQVSEPLVSKPFVSKFPVSKSTASEPPVSEPPMPVVQNTKRTPALSMMSDAEFGETMQHIQRVKEQTVPDEAPAGFARTNAPSVLTADTAAALPSDGGFARSSSFVKLPPSAAQNQTLSVQTTPIQITQNQNLTLKNSTLQNTAVIEEPPVQQQEFRPLFFKNSPPQQKRRW